MQFFEWYKNDEVESEIQRLHILNVQNVQIITKKI